MLEIKGPQHKPCSRAEALFFLTLACLITVGMVALNLSLE